MYNYFYISNNQNKLLNIQDEKKYYKVNDLIGGFSVKKSGDSSCINVLNSFCKNYVSNILTLQSPKIYKPLLIKDAILLEGFVLIYNHDILNISTSNYILEDEFMIVFNTDNATSTVDFKYIKGLK